MYQTIHRSAFSLQILLLLEHLLQRFEQLLTDHEDGFSMFCLLPCAMLKNPEAWIFGEKWTLDVA
jgi:hypothetical protein